MYLLCMKLQHTCCCSSSHYALMLLYMCAWLFKPCALLHKHYYSHRFCSTIKIFQCVSPTIHHVSINKWTCHVSINSNHWMIVNIVSYLKRVSVHYWTLFFKLFLFIYSTRSIAPDDKAEWLITLIGSESNTCLTSQSDFPRNALVIITSLLLNR